MNLTEFLKQLPSSLHFDKIHFETDILGHFDACVIEATQGQKAVVVSAPSYRDYVEKKLLPSLSLHGVEATYCLCVRSVESYEDQITNTISGFSGDEIGLIACLGDETLWRAARIAGAKANILHTVAVCSTLPSRSFFVRNSNSDLVSVGAIYFDLASIRRMSPGDWRETASALELHTNAFLIEAVLAQALGNTASRNVRLAIQEIEPLTHADPDDDDAVSQLSEGYAWLAAARAALGYDTSLDYVMAYDLACPQRMPNTIFDHAAVFLKLLDAMLEVESLEIDPDDCAQHQPPLEIFKRSLKQTLIEDELGFGRMKDAETAWADRIAVRGMIHTLVSAWDDLCEPLRVRSAMLHAVFENRNMPDDLSQVCTVWQHAARFAPRHTLVHLMEILRLLDGALFE